MQQQLSFITNDHVDEVIELHSQLIKMHHREKRQRFSQLLATLSDEAKWLMTFCVWFSLFNLRFHAIEEAAYYSIPCSVDNKTTFQDFLEVIRFFNRKKVTPTRERVLIRFISSCDATYKEFYLKVLSKTFRKGLPLTEVQTHLPIESIDLQEVYGPLQLLQTDFSELTYPVAISVITAPDSPFVVFAKEPFGTFSFRQDGGVLLAADNPIPNDALYVHTPRYTLAGFAEKKGQFTAVDYFDTLKEYREYIKGADKPWKKRIEKLRGFLAGNLLTETETGYVGFANSEEEIIPEISKVMHDTDKGYVVLVDQDTARTGKAFAVEARKVEGIIDSFWIDDERARGFYVWFNGDLFPVEFPFTGKNNAILRSITPVKNKLLEFLYVKIGVNRLGVGREILWKKNPWREKRFRGKNLYIEKCIFCGTTAQRHKNKGICHSCECHLYYLFRQYGGDVWIPPGRITNEKRRQSGWEYTLLNCADYHFQGHILEARDDGYYRFRADTDVMTEYLSRKGETNL